MPDKSRSLSMNDCKSDDPNFEYGSSNELGASEVREPGPMGVIPLARKLQQPESPLYSFLAHTC